MCINYADVKLCERRFTDNSGMYGHLRLFYKKIRVKCDLCAKDFSSKQSMKNHKKNVHQAGAAKTKKYKKAKVSCDICRQTLMGQMNKNRHIELIHFPNKTSCPYGCSGEFENESEWVSHLEGCKSEKLVSK